MAKQATRAPDRYANRNAPPPIGHGWVAFAGSYLMLAGLLNLIWGVTALSRRTISTRAACSGRRSTRGAGSRSSSPSSSSSPAACCSPASWAGC